MRRHCLLSALLLLSGPGLDQSRSFRVVAFQTSSAPRSSLSRCTTALDAKSRKARREVDRSRPKSFYDAIEDAQDKPVKEGPPPKKKKKEGKPSDNEGVASDTERQVRATEAQQRMDERPEVSTMIIDEETGIEVVAQGKSVMDVVTRKAVKLSSMGPEYRLAQMFPGVPPAVRDAMRLNWQTAEVPDMVEALREACSVKLEDGKRGIPPHPSVANKAIDFVLANRDYLGSRMKKTLGRLQMRNMSLGNKDEAREYQKLWRNFLTLENHISAPFRQIIMDAEGRVGPNFGNLDLQQFCGGEIYQRAANYLVLKGMVAHWEKKVVDAEYLERTKQTKENYITILARGDPKRFLPDPPILFTLRECSQVALMSQQMTKAFVDTPELFDDLPVEIRFLESALTIKGGTALRKFIVEEFCPAEGISPEGLREGLRRLATQLENMQIDPYADITNIIERLNMAMSVGTDDERNPYTAYVANKDPNGPGAFQTYTFNHEKLSLVRFLDSQYEGTSGVADLPKQSGLGGFFNFGGTSNTPSTATEVTKDRSKYYKVPDARAAGRPHDLGWLDMLNDEKDTARLGKVPPGRIIPDDE
ncbi:predicted protein [Phaeodactylum tricornutum CCAP 1055/1]|jgi:hypothetical protein|uniref:Uncharacterized protein n=1 Tax=Phaeodactylum tricornutum (strain CCAP 1055/1) TaxID=556484 RepID=B7FQF6_PHATC|nr:predicted protein [Phaeodactylum tricornutum CCAP 1055/1]EEC51325.1 predicted protein [Phaeodactylum tricornutum CCAP 1055/1]|eukprot:XP_002176862.1 predicted protein [Phaeodactylum tricornutum CCAP 1055/1]